MAVPIRTDKIPKSSVVNTETPPQPQKGTWLAFGARSVCTLTGAALGAAVGGYGSVFLAGNLAHELMLQGDELATAVPRSQVILALKKFYPESPIPHEEIDFWGSLTAADLILLGTPFFMAAGAIQGATVGAIAGCCVAKRILTRISLSRPSAAQPNTIKA